MTIKENVLIFLKGESMYDEWKKYEEEIMSAEDPVVAWYGDSQTNYWSIEDRATSSVIVDKKIFDMIPAHISGIIDGKSYGNDGYTYYLDNKERPAVLINKQLYNRIDTIISKIREYVPATCINSVLVDKVNNKPICIRCKHVFGYNMMDVLPYTYNVDCDLEEQCNNMLVAIYTNSLLQAMNRRGNIFNITRGYKCGSNIVNGVIKPYAEIYDSNKPGEVLKFEPGCISFMDDEAELKKQIIEFISAKGE